MFITVKVLKKDWKNLVKDFKKARTLKMDKIFESQRLLPFYKSPKKIKLGQQFKLRSTIAKIVEVKTNFFSRHYNVTISINEKCTASSAIIANIEKESARMIFELCYNNVLNKFSINAFALVDNDNPKAESIIIESGTFL